MSFCWLVLIGFEEVVGYISYSSNKGNSNNRKYLYSMDYALDVVLSILY